MAKKAFKPVKKPGSLTRLAKAAGQSLSQYCGRGDLSTDAKRKCNFWANSKKWNKK